MLAVGGFNLFDLFTGGVVQSAEIATKESVDVDDLFGDASAMTDQIEIDEADLFGVENKTEIAPLKEAKNSTPSKRPRTFKEWMENWNNEELSHEQKRTGGELQASCLNRRPLMSET